MSSYFTAGGGGRAAYRLESLNLDCIKSPSASWASNSSSPSSTLSESTNSQLTIPTRKPRTPRKRPNQTYQEAAAILSTACPKIFPTKHLTKPRSKLKKTQEDKPSSALMMPFGEMDSSDFLINLPDLERVRLRKGLEKYCLIPGEIDSPAARREIGGGDEQQLLQNQEDFDAESMLDEEMEEGIDSILGNAASMESELTEEQDIRSSAAMHGGDLVYGYPVGLGFGHDYGMGREFRAIRTVDEGDWWRFPCVKMVDLNPNMMNVASEKAKKKKKKAKKKKVENKKSIAELVAMDESSSKANKALKNENFEEDDGVPQLPKGGLILKLDYDDVLNAWADKPSPIAGEELGESDVQARLAQIDLFSENGGIREACVMRYKEKRRTRLFSKKIRYQVRKVNADRRPRMKGRFVRTPNSSEE